MAGAALVAVARNVMRLRSCSSIYRLATAAAVALCCCATSSCGGTDLAGADAGRTRASLAAQSPGEVAHFRFFSPTSFWNRRVRADAPLARRSRLLVQALATEIADDSETHLTIDTASYSVPVYTVSAGQPTVPVQVREKQQPALAQAWSKVPLPPDALPAAGTDGELVVWQPSSDRMWEFWRLAHEGGVWRASWGGAMRNVSTNSGVYGPGAWPGAQPWWGVPASSLALVGGLITLEDLQDGTINHALALSVPNTRAGIVAFPANRTDGRSDSPLALPEGAHLRLDPHLNLDALHLPRLTLMIARAAQRYGIYLRDSSPNVGFYGQDPTTTASNPYTGATGYFEGKTAGQVLASFPVQHLQVLAMRLRRVDTRVGR